MRVLNIHGVNDVRLDPTEPPHPGNSDVVIKVKACGVCGSDLSYIKMGGIHRKPGGVTPIGHEAAGEIISVGSNVKGVRVGQRYRVGDVLIQITKLRSPCETLRVYGPGIHKAVVGQGQAEYASTAELDHAR